MFAMTFDLLSSFDERYNKIGIDFVTPFCPETNPLSITSVEENVININVRMGDDSCTALAKAACIIIFMLIRIYLLDVLSKYAN